MLGDSGDGRLADKTRALPLARRMETRCLGRTSEIGGTQGCGEKTVDKQDM